MFNWLFGKDMKKPNYEVSEPYASSRKVIRGIFEYQNIVKCNVLGIEYIVNAKVTDSETIPETKCQCGAKIRLMDAPIVDVRKLGEKTMTIRRGQLIRLDLGHRHSIRLGETLIYEEETA